MTSLALSFFAGRERARGVKAGEACGEMLMLSSRPSSSAFRFRVAILEVWGETAGESRSLAMMKDRADFEKQESHTWIVMVVVECELRE